MPTNKPGLYFDQISVLVLLTAWSLEQQEAIYTCKTHFQLNDFLIFNISVCS